MCDIKHVDFYASDWLEGTAGLTLEERGFYWVACSVIYSRGGPVTRDHLRRVTGVDGRVFRRVLNRLLDLGKLVEQDGLISQKRCSKELAKAQLRLSKWRKNLDNHEKSTTYADRAGCIATSQESKSLESSQPSQSPSPARAREAPPPPPQPAPAREVAARDANEARAGLAGLADLTISEEMVEAAKAERERLGLPEVNLRVEADKTEDHWRTHPPRNPRAAWLGRARIAKQDKTNVIEMRPRTFTPEEMAAGLQRALAKMHAEQAMEARA